MCDISECAFLILAGGKSSRMGRCKAELPIGNQTFLEHMIEKGIQTGFSEILISGAVSHTKAAESVSSFSVPVRIIPDVLKDRGPLGGLYSCFLNSPKPACFVISVDVPLLSRQTIRQLVKMHDVSSQKATLLCHEGQLEPLIGIYNIKESSQLYDLIKDHSAAVFSYLKHIGYRTVELKEPAETIFNFNTPEDYLKLNEKYDC